MKQSYFTTPRTRNDGVWLYNCDPIEKHEGTADKYSHWIYWGAFASVAFAAIFLLVTL